MNEKQLKYTALVISIILAVTSIVNMSVTTYVLWNDRQTASMSPNSPENISIKIEADIGRPSPLTFLFRQMQDWVSSYTVGGTSAENATTALTVSVTGSNVGSMASLDYYVEAKETGGSGSSYRFLAGNGSVVSVGGASLVVDDDRSITSHLIQMGLSTDQTWTIDYYVYVIASVTGAISGETLTSEISYTKFDTVTYTYEDPGTWTEADWICSNSGYAGYVYGTASHRDCDSPTGNLRIGNDDGMRYHAWMCWDMDDFTNPPPQGSIIQEAYVEFYVCKSYTGRQVNTSAYYSGSWSSGYIDNYAEWQNIHDNYRTDEYTVWNMPSASQYDWVNTTNLNNVMQELVDSGSWNLGSKITFFWDATDDSENNLPEFYGWLAYKKPSLYIRWTTYSASWYDIPPLSVVDMPVTLEVGAVLVTAVVVAYILTDIKRRKNR